MNSGRVRGWTALLPLICCLVLWLAAPGCGGDDDDDDQDLSISYAADGEPGETGIALALNRTDGDLLIVDVVTGGGFVDAYALAFRLTYDNEVMTFEDRTAGEALAADGVTVICLANENARGELIFGVSRADSFDGADPEAGNPIASLAFRATGKGETRLDFLEEHRGMADNRLRSLDVAEWIGGAVEVR